MSKSKKIEIKKRNQGILDMKLEGHTLTEIGEKHKISRQRVTQVLSEMAQDMANISWETFEEYRGTQRARYEKVLNRWFHVMLDVDPINADLGTKWVLEVMKRLDNLGGLNSDKALSVQLQNNVFMNGAGDNGSLRQGVEVQIDDVNAVIQTLIETGAVRMGEDRLPHGSVVDAVYPAQSDE